MSSIASSVNRVPNLLRSTTALAQINRTNLALFRVSEQLSSGRAITRPSQDTMAAAMISTLDDSLERAGQVRRNLNVAAGSLATLDSALGQATDLLLEARDMGLGQLNIGSDIGERAAQAAVIDSLIQSMYGLANRTSEVGHVFAGSRPGSPAIEAFLGGFRYRGSGPGLHTDLGSAGNLPITLGGQHILGSTSSRVESSITLQPELMPQTRLADLRGQRGLGIQPGEIELSYNGNPVVRVDLSTADTAQDVANIIEAALRQQEQALNITILGPDGVSVGTEGLHFDLNPLAGINPTVTFTDIGVGTTAADLGLSVDANGAPISFSAVNTDAGALAPLLTPLSPIGEVGGSPLGSIRIRAHGREVVVDLSTVETFQDLRNKIEGTGLGVRVEINADRNGFSIVNEVAGGRNSALTIEEVPGNNQTAARLGIRTLGPATPLSAFNDGRGVEVKFGATDPTTGLAEPSLDTDFTITLGDGTELHINLHPDDMVNVQTMLASINAQADAQLTAAGRPTTLFTAGLTDGPNGLAFTQDTTDPLMTSPLTIRSRNNSPAAEQLGLMNGQYDQTTGTFLGEDRAKVRVDNVFTHLIDLRDALLGNDEFGIQIATDRLNADLDRVAEARGMVGGLARRVDQEQELLIDRQVNDEALRSTLRDVDYASASTLFTMLQTQLQAAYQVTATSNRLSLMDFI